MYRQLTNFIVFNCIQFNILPISLYQPARGANGSGGSSVIIVTGIQAVGYRARKGGFSLVLSLQIRTEPHIHFFWMGPADIAAGTWNWLPLIS